MKNKKAMEMSWSMLGWLILAIVALIIIVVIVSKGVMPGFNGLSILEGK